MTVAIQFSESENPFDHLFAEKIRIRQEYLPTKLNEVIDERLKQLVQNAKACLAGGGLKQRALVILGESGTGKSSAIAYHLARIPDFQPYVCDDGHLVDPLLRIEAPGTCTTKSFAIALLSALGIHAVERAPEFELYATLKHQLKLQGKLFVCVDEMQHVIRGASTKSIAKIQDVLKNLTQIDGWPLHIIFVGTPALAAFMEGDRQLANRCRVLFLPPLDPSADAEFIRETIRKVVEDVAHLKIGWNEKHDLPGRLVAASLKCTGTLIQYVQEACFYALDERSATVSMKHFAAAYQANTGCIKRDNIFSVVDWSAIKPENAIAEFKKAVAAV